MIAVSFLALAIAAPQQASGHRTVPRPLASHAPCVAHARHAKLVAQAPLPTAAPVATAAPTSTATPGTNVPAAGTTPASPLVTPAATTQPTLVPTSLAPATVAATPSPYAYRFVPRQPSHLEPGQPQIFAVYINQKKLRSHGPIRIKVETSANVVKVVSRSNGREGNVPFVAAGDFEATSVLPKIPFIAAGMSVDLEFIATGADGRKTTVRVPVLLD